MNDEFGYLDSIYGGYCTGEYIRSGCCDVRVFTAAEARRKTKDNIDKRIKQELESIMVQIEASCCAGDEFIYYDGSLTEQTISKLRDLDYKVVGNCEGIMSMPSSYTISWEE